MFLKPLIRSMIPLRTRAKVHNLLAASQTKQALMKAESELLWYKILYYYKCNATSEYEAELNFIEEAGSILPFPYKQLKPSPSVECDFDKSLKMPYVLHAGNRLYFPVKWTVNEAKVAYLNFIVTENIFGGGYSEKAPHQYLSHQCNVNEGDIVYDVGASEGLFLLHVIDKVKRGYIFEPNPIWKAPLKATFAPFREKVTIVDKFAADVNSGDKTRIDNYGDDLCGDVFIKMDIEGYEGLAFSGSSKLLIRDSNVKIACCTYHKHEDAVTLKAFFDTMNYSSEYSDGYMLFSYHGEIKPPYFRKGLIRAWKRKINCDLEQLS